METKVCTKCHEEKPVSEYWKHTVRGKEKLYCWCKPCFMGVVRMNHAKTRLEVLTHYSGGIPKCACPGCFESRLEFLSIDHINGGGNKHRRETGEVRLVRWILRNEYPNGFRVLCHNCNHSRGAYGYCPHENGGVLS